MDCSEIKNYALASGTGFTAYIVTNNIAKKVSKVYSNSLLNLPINTSLNEQEIFRDATYAAYKNSGLKTKRVYLHDVKPENVQWISRLLNKKSEIVLENNKFVKNYLNICGIIEYPQKIFARMLKKCPKEKINKNLNVSKAYYDVAQGKRAFYSPLTRDISINIDRLGIASFHEMGHALNATGGQSLKILKIIACILPLGIPLIFAIGLLTPKKNNNKNNDVLGFVKNNAGKLTFATMIPTIAEEGLASIRGGKLAKNVLDSKLLKKVNISNFKAWTTYLVGSTLSSLAVAFAVKVRDKVAK